MNCIEFYHCEQSNNCESMKNSKMHLLPKIHGEAFKLEISMPEERFVFCRVQKISFSWLIFKADHQNKTIGIISVIWTYNSFVASILLQMSKFLNLVVVIVIQKFKFSHIALSSMVKNAE